MSRIIRTVRITGPVVTLGQAERDLYLPEGVAPPPSVIDLPRLLDEATVDFVLDHLRHEAAELVGDELPEIARHPGRYIRAAARTSTGRPVVAIVLPDGKLSTATLQSELATLTAALGAAPLKLTYGLTSRPDRPLEVERVPDDELV